MEDYPRWQWQLLRSWGKCVGWRGRGIKKGKEGKGSLWMILTGGAARVSCLEPHAPSFIPPINQQTPHVRVALHVTPASFKHLSIASMLAFIERLIEHDVRGTENVYFSQCIHILSETRSVQYGA